jgi:two-component system sensor histidine kinase PilS (NtrC family)
MFSLDENRFTSNATLIQKVQTLIIGRLIVIFLLLVTSWVWYSGSLEFSLDRVPQGALLVLIISVGLTAVYFLLLRLSSNLFWQVRLQFYLDALLTTWLVWRTGDLTSPYITLYIVLIAISSIFLRPSSTILMAMLCVAMFMLLTVLTWFSVIESVGTPQTLAKTLQILSFHVVAFMIVGLLAARLSERRTSGDELKEATKNLANLRALHERIIESIRSGLITTDLEGVVFTFNASATEITGFTADEMYGRSVFELFGDIREHLDLALRSSSDMVPRFEANLSTPEGFAVRIGYSIVKLYSEENVASGFIITFQDLTEIRSMEESIRRKDRLAAVGRVGAGLAHEIRNPLGAMRGAIQVLESSMPPNSIQTDLMGIILRESDRLNSIITNFLSYAKPKVGNLSEVDVRDAVRDTVKLLRHSPDLKETHSIEEIMPDQPIFISADATQLQQIFWNLTRNAIQAMPDGGKLTIRLEPIRSDIIRIIFEDTGKGMSPEQVEQLFEPFSNSTSGGTGLGLSIVYQIIRDHGGTINVSSSEGEGTKILIELPRDPKHALAAEGENIDESYAPTLLNQYLKVKKRDTEISS